ncbi:hypothetical protein [Paraburkholderia youngii]|uniref:hypothetical protein n=1 Tax=Paraburkholderia youngii TaxID=2782701 RepID=UPI00158FA6FD|nr:hypothetical protein [Paraburkholderia youngii]NUX59334.1 hypothetical protein [Paraburkholderia youngii]
MARDYLSTPHLSSPSLEWLIIDALLFNETVAFARSICWLSPGQPWPQFKYHLLRGSAKWFREAVALVLTFVLAQFVDSSRGIGFWAVAATITAVRWLRPDTVSKERARFTQLLADMSNAQSLLSDSGFQQSLASRAVV